MTDQEISQVTAESSFKAFVSYSHADKAAAQKLHRKLETYRLPKHLREVPAKPFGNMGSEDGKIGAIFRDREDLPAAEDLSESVKAALSASEALVVLCSPDAQKSPWVAREIELFREIHPDRPVLAAILRGEPEEAFPEPLKQGREPLAADLRKEGDGARLGFLKVVAGIAGVPLDALINRDAQRRLRRVTAITVAAVAAVVVMALMTTFALQQRNEARLQRSEAEGLVEYMLTDLREDLAGVAGLKVLTKVNRRALAYYARQGDSASLPAESLERRSRIISALGADAEDRGDLKLARDNFELRVNTTALLLKEDIENTDRQFDHALSLNRLAVLDEKEGDIQASEQRLRASWTILSNIGASSSREVEHRRAVTHVTGNLCAIGVSRDNVTEDTLEKCTLSASLGRALSTESTRDSLDPYNLVFNLIWLGEALAKVDRQEAAEAVRTEALTLTKQITVANPGNRKIMAQYMQTIAHLSKFESAKVRRMMLKEAAQIAGQLIRLDPENMAYKESLNSYNRRLGEEK